MKAARTATSQVEIGDTIGEGRYEIRAAPTGEGDLLVAQAFDNRLSREVALLLAKHQGPASSATHELELIAMTAKRLDGCQEIPSLYDLGIQDGRPYLVMQWPRAQTLRAALSAPGARLKPEQVRQMAIEISRALQAIHSEGLVHRGVCPENILVNELGNFLLWGLSGCTETGHHEPEWKPFFPLVARQYAAPELLSADQTAPSSGGEAQADLYALGVVVAETLLGAEAITSLDGANYASVEHPLDTDAGTSESPAAARLLEIANRLMSRSRADRPSSAKAVIVALEDVLAETHPDVDSLLLLGETNELEFKSSLLYAHGPEVPREHKFAHADELEFSVLKAIAGFFNANGGTLLIGVDDDGNVVGIEDDYARFSERQNSDVWHRHLVGILTERLEPKTRAMAVDISFEPQGELNIAAIRVPRSSEAVWLNVKGKGPCFFVRSGPRTIELEGPEMSNYMEERLVSRMQEEGVRT